MSAATELPLADMDAEVIEICKAMNLFEGIHTVESCCGHGDHPFRIWFKAQDIEHLPPLLWCFDGCHSGHYGWQVIVKTDCVMQPATFMVEGPVGQAAYDQAGVIAELLRSVAKDD
jgi:hypothetical protein